MSNKINMKTVDGLEEALASKSNPIGSIITSTIPLNDAGLHLADGALISGSGSYADFVDYMAGLVSTNPEIFASGYESETSIGSTISGGDYSAQPAANAFDGSLSTFWGSLQLGSTNIVGHAYIGRSGLTKPVKKIRINQGYSDSGNNYCTQLLFQYSNDGITWNDITSISNGANKTWQEWILPDYTPTGDTHSFRVLAYGGFSGTSSNNWLVSDIELYYWSANSESVWQSSVSTYGVCGKYVYDSVNNTIRLPKLEGFIEGTNTTTAVGDIAPQAVKLPDLTGRTGHQANTAANAVSGVFYNDGVSVDSVVGTTHQATSAVAMKASRVSSVYSGNGTDTAIHPQAIKVFYYIVIATSTKTDIQVDIDEIATDLNGKADVDASNLNASGKSLLSGLSAPSATYENWTLLASNSDYDIPANGWLTLNKQSNAAGQHVLLFEPTVISNYGIIFSSAASQNIGITVRVRKGQKIRASYTAAGATQFFRFFYDVGEV